MAKKKKLKIAIQGIATSFHEVAALTHSQIGRPGGAEHAFQSLYDIVVRQQPEVLR